MGHAWTSTCAAAACGVGGSPPPHQWPPRFCAGHAGGRGPHLQQPFCVWMLLQAGMENGCAACKMNACHALDVYLWDLPAVRPFEDLLDTQRLTPPPDHGDLSTCWAVSQEASRPAGKGGAHILKEPRGSCQGKISSCGHSGEPHARLACFEQTCVSKWKEAVRLCCWCSVVRRVRLFATPWAAALQASLSVAVSWSLLRLVSVRWGCWLC